jgi:hypothetical protein
MARAGVHPVVVDSPLCRHGRRRHSGDSGNDEAEKSNDLLKHPSTRPGPHLLLLAGVDRALVCDAMHAATGR